MIRYTAIVLTVLLTAGCTGMLPKKTTVTHSQWDQYTQISDIGKNIHAGQSLDDLKNIGIDVHKIPNVEHLTHLDIARRFGLIGGRRAASLKIPEGVQCMLDAAELGRGYELTVENTLQAREGGFWRDLLNFKRTTRETGWKYSILIITTDNKIQYVLHKGNPNINKITVEKNPLGPFQKINGYVIIDLLENTID